ncbi:MAG: hypothetical protein ACI9HE_003797 [Planctomycetota bacterium]|jgi:hypothetical protein
MRLLFLLLLALWGAVSARCEAVQDPEARMALVPWPSQVFFTEDVELELFSGMRIVAEDPSLMPLAQLLAEELLLVCSLRMIPIEDQGTQDDIILRLDPAAPVGGYQFAVRRAALVAGITYDRVAEGTAALLQAVFMDGGRTYLPHMLVTEQPRSSWRGVMIDCATQRQPLDVLLRAVELCRYYRMETLHLRLANESTHAYTRVELETLVTYAQVRGVQLMPELFLSEPFWTDLDPARVMGEVAAAFPHSRYMHLGKAPFHPEGLEPAVVLEKRRNHLSLAKVVRDLGRVPVVWDDMAFGAAGALPADLIVLVRDGSQLAAGKPAPANIVNATLMPLSLIGGGRLTPQSAPRRFDAAQIAAWNVRQWASFVPSSAIFDGFQLSAEVPVLGGHLWLWEQQPSSVIEDLRLRVPVLAERLARAGPMPVEATLAPDNLLQRTAWTDERFQALIYPAQLLGGQAGTEGRYWIDGPLQVRAASPGQVRFTRDGSVPKASSPRWIPGLLLKESAQVAVRLFTSAGLPLGFAHRRSYAPRPVNRVRASIYPAPRAGWPAVPDFTRLKPSGQELLPGLRGSLLAGSAGVLLQATFVAPAAGEFHFDLRTVDGPAQIWIDGSLVVDRKEFGQWDGTSGSITLEAGAHSFEVRFAQGPMKTLCQAFVRGPGIDVAVLVDRYLQAL